MIYVEVIADVAEGVFCTCVQSSRAKAVYLPKMTLYSFIKIWSLARTKTSFVLHVI